MLAIVGISQKKGWCGQDMCGTECNDHDCVDQEATEGPEVADEYLTVPSEILLTWALNQLPAKSLERLH